MASKKMRKFLKIGALAAGIGATALGAGAIGTALAKVKAKKKELKSITDAVDVKKVVSLKGSAAGLPATAAEGSTIAAAPSKLPLLLIAGAAVLVIFLVMRK
jgi:hypothetical protein